MSPLLFDPTTHTYTRDGVIVPSVSSILRDAGLVDLDFVPQNALDRGVAVHDAIHFDNEKDLDEASLDPVVVPYLIQARRFFSMMKADVLLAEKIVESFIHNYAGRLDLLIFSNVIGQKILIDIKTGKMPAHVSSQLGAYCFALAEAGVKVDRVACLELKPDDFKLTTWEPLQAQAEWFRTLAMARVGPA